MKTFNICTAIVALCLSCSVPVWTAFGFDTQPLVLPVTSVYDGDTLQSELPDQTLPATLRKVSVRVYGIDTPEKGHQAKCEKERRLADKATKFVNNFIGVNRSDHPVYMVVVDPKYDKYGGRILGSVFIHGTDLARLLIDNGYAYEYFGDAKQDHWC